MDVSVDLIKIGDYVRLGESQSKGWKAHPFPKNNFLISNQEQVEIVKGLFDTVVIDCLKSTERQKELQQSANFISEKEETLQTQPSSEWEQLNSPTEKLSQALNCTLPAKEKAGMVVEHSAELISQLLSTQLTNDSVKGTVVALKGMVGNLISDPELSDELLKITSHDYYTYTHSVSVGFKAMVFAKHYLGTTDQTLLKELGVGFFLHDAGKAGVDPDILNKPGKLSASEWSIMRNHPEMGVKQLAQANSLSEEIEIIVVQHHEKLDGSGYPYGLKGKEFHVFGQICALADIYDALTAKRSYKEGMTSFNALLIMQQKMAHHFDAKVLSSFIKLFCEAPKAN
ncbi:HD-GYP domain-containing protein [Neptunomonas sp.]|uniref:HD-GYP domain-containing protein n=1 Tax=Neptunomonas sp. TaxID=1971898 RepID=UPI0025E96D91|nr:HD-GYP domain-containing protein [Neptunomonas sp.]